MPATPAAAFRSSSTAGFSLAAAPSLGPLVAKWGRCRSRTEIAALAVDEIPKVFGTNACGVILAASSGKAAEVTLNGLSDREHDVYDNFWRPHDLVHAKVLAEHVAAMRRHVMADSEWRRTPFCLEFAKRVDLIDCMQAPLYGAGGFLAGAVYFARPERYRGFDGADLLRATVFAGYLSASLARVSAQHFGGLARERIDLTKREHEIVHLVAHGLSNPEISASLQIARETVKQTLRRVYRKLEVNGRAAMVARLSELGWL